MINIFRIDEKLATTALQNTGNIEEALVWIYNDKEDKTNKTELINHNNN